ncbi:Leucine Rich repeats (2 copies) [Maioricimonas rarisocia]|uniref:Leucine Rich repeats (2 copies) n=1 Tax=Maioricimonas rarisocia TaxID=2528026 RepID=A0A517Z6V4_9PLAN|nr:Leucine Rich repeats (2 copies) [Maioricimonas rarisocia]
MTSMPLLGDRGVDAIGVSRDLSELYLDNCGISNASLNVIGGLSHLWSVSLCSNRIGDQGVKRVGALKQLRLLQLNCTDVTGAGLACLSDVKRMYLHMNGCPVDDSGIGECLRALPSLGLLALNDTRVTDAAMQGIASLALLEDLRLEGTAVTDEGVLSLLQHPSLCRVYLRRTNVSQAVIARLRSESAKRLIVYA